MNRTTILVVCGAVVVGLALAGGAALLGFHNTSNSSQKPQGGRPASSERAPEAENHSVGDLPALEAAARRFLAGYLRVVYGTPGATIDGIRNASPRLLNELRLEGGHVTPAQSQRTPRLTRVAVVKDGPIAASATAQIKDSPDPPYPLSFHLEKATSGWVVVRIGGP